MIQAIQKGVINIIVIASAIEAVTNHSPDTVHVYCSELVFFVSTCDWLQTSHFIETDILLHATIHLIYAITAITEYVRIHRIHVCYIIPYMDPMGYTLR